MPQFEMECQYCGHKWEYTTYFMPKDRTVRCNVCNDPNVKYESLDELKKKKDVFGYNVKKE